LINFWSTAGIGKMLGLFPPPRCLGEPLTPRQRGLLIPFGPIPANARCAPFAISQQLLDHLQLVGRQAEIGEDRQVTLRPWRRVEGLLLGRQLDAQQVENIGRRVVVQGGDGRRTPSARPRRAAITCSCGV
jgi:hypothetical protein